MAPPTPVETLCAAVRPRPAIAVLLVFETGWIAYQLAASNFGWKAFDPAPFFLLQRANLAASAALLLLAAKTRTERAKRERHHRERMSHWLRGLDALAMDLACHPPKTAARPISVTLLALVRSAPP